MEKRGENDMKKRLIAYFSRADENYFQGDLRYVEVGNTEIVAKKLQAITGADLLPIRMKSPYSPDYKECVEQARRDYETQARPELTGLPENLRDYTVVYLGYPNYCGTVPMPVLTFLESFDFSGKKIRPFCTHEGGGMGTSETDIMQSGLGAILEMGAAIVGSQAEKCDELLRSWVDSFYHHDE